MLSLGIFFYNIKLKTFGQSKLYFLPLSPYALDPVLSNKQVPISRNDSENSEVEM